MQYMFLWGKVLAAIQQVFQFFQPTLYLFTKCKACFCRKLLSVIQTFLYLYTECKTCFNGKNTRAANQKNSPSVDILSIQKNVKPFFDGKVLAVIQTLLYLFTSFVEEGGILCVSENTSSSLLAHLAKGHVSFCHHLASVIRRKL
jgi:hypothetical protein